MSSHLPIEEAERLAGRRLDRRMRYTLNAGEVVEIVHYTHECTDCEGFGCRRCAGHGRRRSTGPGRLAGERAAHEFALGNGGEP